MPQSKQLTLADVSRMTRDEVRKAYTRLRHQAMDRLDKLGEFAERGYKIAQKSYPAGYRFNAKELRAKLVDVSQFMHNPLSIKTNLQRYESEQIAKLQKHGINVNKSNFPEFTKFMEQYRESNLDRLFSSTQIADQFNRMQRMKVTPADIAKHQQEYSKRDLTMQQAIVLTAKRKQRETNAKDMRRKARVK